jgi:anti-sigma B factor antagonist
MANPPPSPSFEMMRAAAGGLPVVRLRGRLTLGEGSKSLRACMADIAGEGHRLALLDLAEVSYVDSSGLGAMVAGYNSLKLKGGSVVLFAVPTRVRDLIQMSGLTAVFRMFGTEQEALASLN